MEKQFLVTISNDLEHLFGVRFICSFFHKMSEHRITLLHICRRDCNDMTKTLMDKWEGPADNIQGYLTVGAKRSIEKAEELLKGCRMSIDQIITKTVAERYGKVKDILRESSKGLYDTIVLGRRASYTLQWMFERPADETVQTMIKDSSCTSPLWICPDPEPGRKNVLLCVDGSENAFRAADHVGFILSAQAQHAITLYHVENTTEKQTEKIFQRAENILRDNDISAERINRSSSWGVSVPRSILGEVEKGGYAAVAVGLYGNKKQGLLKNLNLAGGTTLKLISKIEKASLWCCP